MSDFPTVQAEPTSDIPAIAWNDDLPRYSVVSCPECGGRAFKRRARGGVTNYACRNCRFGAQMLQRKSNYGGDWEEVREWILEREEHQCWECGSERRLHVHYIEKLVWFETTDEANQPDNLVALCDHCHRDLENQPEHFEAVMVDA